MLKYARFVFFLVWFVVSSHALLAQSSVFWRDDHEGSAGRWILSGHSITAVFSNQESPVLTRNPSPVRIGLGWEGSVKTSWQIREQSVSGKWSIWKELPSQWREKGLQINQVDTSKDTKSVQIRYIGEAPRFIDLVWLTQIGETQVIRWGDCQN